LADCPSVLRSDCLPPMVGLQKVVAAQSGHGGRGAVLKLPARLKVEGMIMKRRLSRVFYYFAHAIGRIRKSYFFEDYRRVYPGGLAYYPFGVRRKFTTQNLNNFRNHQKLYFFVSQFSKGKKVVDVGCGCGHGCEVLKRTGAADVYGCDVSKSSIAFARSRFGGSAQFNCQTITDMSRYPDDFAEVVVSSEVLEHIKEYGKEEQAILEMKRITRKGGLLVIATPNSELLGDHGFYFDEMSRLFASHFSKFCIFENAFVPFGPARAAWEQRLKENRVGVVISELINVEESVVPEGIVPEIKQGHPPGKFSFDDIEIDTTLLHNTHSWVVLARNEK
jgi:2-polyprenyl-3-methyl-5-hydroxy-6-metoxy-1,4-benzoquinol methylase